MWDEYVKSTVSIFSTMVLVSFETKIKNLFSLAPLAYRNKLSPRFIDSRSLSFPELAHSLAPVNVHLLTPCIHKLLQGRLCLADLLHDYSMTELRQLSSRRWRLRDSIEDPQSWSIASSVLGQEPAIWCPS